MKTRYRFLIIIIILTSSSCVRNNQVREQIISTICCLDSIKYDSVDSSFLSPASIILKLTNCDVLSRTSISSVIFPYVELNDSSYFDVWADRISSKQSPNTVFVYIYTNSFQGSDFSIDSIEHVLSERIGIVTSKNDTIFVTPCDLSEGAYINPRAMLIR